MNTSTRKHLGLTVLFLMAFFVCPSGLLAFQSKVIAIQDGDTIEVLHEGAPLRVRLYGIDCPERHQDFGTKARQFTSDKVFGKTVEIVPTEADRYERTVAKVYLDGQYLNEMLVAEGLAWWYQQYAPHDEDLALAEQKARSLQNGLWSQPDPVPPWQFRRRKSIPPRESHPLPGHGPPSRLTIMACSVLRFRTGDLHVNRERVYAFEGDFANRAVSIPDTKTLHCFNSTFINICDNSYFTHETPLCCPIDSA